MIAYISDEDGVEFHDGLDKVRARNFTLQLISNPYIVVDRSNPTCTLEVMSDNGAPLRRVEMEDRVVTEDEDFHVRASPDDVLRKRPSLRG